MTTRRLLYLNTHCLSAYAWRQGKLLPEGRFEGDSESLANFAEYLQQQRNSQFSLLANVAEEGHVLETIPYLQGKDRQTLIARKIGQHFLGTPLAATVSLGYEKAKRKNEKLLISALTNPAYFAPWLTRINAAEVPLAGIYSIAQLGGQLLKKLGYGKPRGLLLTVQDHSIRESFIVDGQALFSRMAPLTDSSIAGIASSLAVEASKLQQYLIGQRQVGRDEILPVFIVAHPQALSAIQATCPDNGQLTYTLIDSHTAAQKLRRHTPPADSRSEHLFLHLLSTAPPKEQFAGESYRHDFRLSQIRQGIIAVSLLTVLASALFSAKEIYQAYALREESRALSVSEADLSWRYREISATFPQLGIDNETLRRVTTRYSDLIRQQRQLGPAYRVVSLALNEVPNISLDSIEWKIGRSGQSTVGPAVVSMAAAIAGTEEVTTVRGNIRPERNATTRQTLATFEKFVERLRGDPANKVSVLQQPFDMESGRALRGGDNEDENSLPRQFVVEVSRNIAP